MRELPTEDEFFASPTESMQSSTPINQSPIELPTEDEFFAAPRKESIIFAKNPTSSPAIDEFFRDHPVGHVVKAFQGTVEGAMFEGGDYGIQPGSETENLLRQTGIFNDYMKGEQEFHKSVNEAFIRPAAVAMDLAWREANAFAGGIGAALQQTSEEIDKKLPAFAQGILPEFTEYFLQHKADLPPHIPSPTEVARARSIGVIGETESTYFGLKEPTPAQEAARQEATTFLREEPVKDIHMIAREIAPEVFEKYDALQEKKDTLRSQLDELAAKRDETLTSAPPLSEELQEAQSGIDMLLDKVRGVESRLTKKQTTQLEDLRKQQEFLQQQAETIRQSDTPEMIKLREELQKLDYASRDIAPQISSAYRVAQAEVPPPREIREPEIINEIKEEIPEVVATEGTPIQEQLQNINSDVSRKLVEAGRPLEEADTAAQLVSEHYKAISEMGWAKGTPEEIYRREAAEIIIGKEKSPRKVTELAQKAKGKIRLTADDVKAVITLFKNADASTFIHETGHAWLDEMMRYAKAEDAPTSLLKDKKTIDKWLGIKEGEEITRIQHEKFARGFERYLMEGVAPSRALSDVFAKFKKWLTDIYQAVQKLKAPITDDIRDVFDRLLSAKPEKMVIAAERQIPRINEPEVIAQNNTPDPVPAPAAGVKPTAQATNEMPSTIAEKESPSNVASNLPESSVRAMETTQQEKPTAQEKYNLANNPNAKLGAPKSDLVDKAGNIRLDNLNTPEDVNRVIREIATENGDFLDARRGRISEGQVLDLADALGIDEGYLNRRKLGEAYNAEQIVGARRLVIRSATNLRDLAYKAANGDEISLKEYAEARIRHMMVQEQVSGITAEAGRALRAFQKLEGGAEAKALGELIKENTNLDLFQLQREAQLMSELDSPQKISKLIQDSRKATYPEMLIEFWINSLLSGPITHIKNTVGNALIALNSVAETAIASGVGKILGSENRIHIDEAKARFYGIMQGASEGMVAARKIIKDENAIAGSHTIENFRAKAIPGTTGKVIRIPTRFLAAEDEIFKAIGYRQELNTLAYRAGIKEGLQGEALASRVAEILQNPTEEMMKAAITNAEYQTFTNSLGPTGRGIQNFANSHFLAKLVVPFVRTPVNILKYAGERTPLGLLSKEIRDNISGKNGTRARDMQMAKLALGTTIATAAMWQTMQGNLTGGGPSDPKHKSLLRMTGWQPYSVRIGDMYYSYEWLDPLATVAGTAADLADAYKAGAEDEENINKIYTSTVASISKNIFSKLSLRGISDFIQLVSDPDRYGENYFKNFASSFVPSLIGTVARTNDPVLREARTVLDGIKNRIPGFKEELFPQRDIWGNPIVSEGTLGPDMLSPIRISSFDNDPVNKALLKIGFFPSKPQRKIRGVELTDQQYDDYTRIGGNMARMRLTAYFSIPAVQQLPAEIQRKTVTSMIESSRETARRIVMMNNPEIIRKSIDLKLGSLAKEKP